MADKHGTRVIMAAPEEPPRPRDIVKTLRRRRRLRAGLAQLGYVIAGVVLALLTVRITVGPMADASKVSGLLQAIGGGLITFIALVFSLLFLVLQHASTNMSPRLLLFRDRPLVWHAMGMFVGIFVFAATASVAVASQRTVSAVVPALTILLVLIGLAMSRTLQLTAFAAVQLGPVLYEVTARGLAVIRALYPRRDQAEPIAPVELGPVSRQVCWPHQNAVLRQLDLPALLAGQGGTHGVIAVAVAVGSTLALGSVVFTIHGESEVTDAQLLALLEVGPDRTFEQDPLLSFRLLNDIALRALSPAVNDPATAVQAIAGVEDLLFSLLNRELGVGEVRDSTGRVRVVLSLPSWERYVQAGTESLPYVINSPTVRSRLSVMLDRLIDAAPADRATALRTARASLS